MRSILPFGRGAARSPAVESAAPPPPPPPRSAVAPAERETIRALGFFCGALTRGGALYADAGAGGAAFAHFATLMRQPDIRADLHAIFAESCLEGAHVRHVRELDAFINTSALADCELARELTHALRIVLAQEKRDSGFRFENGTERSIAIFKHLLSLVRRAPNVFAALASPEGGVFDLRAIEHRLLDERLDHADHARDDSAAPDLAVSATTAEIAGRLGLSAPYSSEAVQAARRKFAARWHPDRAPEHKREQATRALAEVNAALDEIASKLAG
jgi:hypothetical protein